MINEKTFNALNSWFREYSKGFLNGKELNDMGITAKLKHSILVSREIMTIGKSLNLRKDMVFLAGITGLLHDIGRFRQFAQYGTFFDHKSENHALLGIKVLKENRTLAMLGRECEKTVISAIRNHNMMKLPGMKNEKYLFFAKLLRDADKLDIYRVLKDYYLRKNDFSESVLEIDIPDTPGVSAEICRDILRNKTVKSEKIKSINDLRLMQISWIYDVNYKKTFQLIKQRKYLGILFSMTPKTELTGKIYNEVKKYLESKS